VTNVIQIYRAPRGHAGRIAIPRWLLSSPIWHEASVDAKACFVEITALFDGHNNGRLKFGITSAERKLGISRSRARKALSDLRGLGLAEDLSNSDRKPATWSLAHLYCNVTGKPAIMPWQSAAERARRELLFRTYPWSRDQVDAVLNDCALIENGGTFATADDRAYADAAWMWVDEVFPHESHEEMLRVPDIKAKVADYLTEREVAHPPLGFSHRAQRAA